MLTLYAQEHRELSRIASYQMQKQVVLVCLGLILVVAGVAFYFLGMAAAVAFGIFGVALLGTRLSAKHLLYCPRCRINFYGKFKFLMPYTDKCVCCGFPLVPPANSSGPLDLKNT